MAHQRQLMAKEREYPRTFREWGISVTLVKGEDGRVYFPVKQMCEALGIDAERQMRALNATPDYRAALVDMPLLTAGGVQKVACLHKKEAAWWLINLDDAHCKKEIRGHLQEIKQRLMDAADAILFGDIAHEPEGERGLLASNLRLELMVACLECGARHRVIAINGEQSSVTLEREK